MKWFKCPMAHAEAFRGMSDAQLGKLIKASLNYIEYGELPAEPEVAFVFPFIKISLDESIDSYQKSCETNKRNRNTPKKESGTITHPFTNRDDPSPAVAESEIREDQKKKEARSGEPSAFLLAEKLSEAFAHKNIKQRDDVKSLSKRISQLLKSGVSFERISECTEWLGNNYFKDIYNGYTFQEHFYALSEAVECVTRENERIKQDNATEEEQHRLKEEEQEQRYKAMREAMSKDRFHLVRQTAAYPAFARNSLKQMIKQGKTTAEEAEQIAKELNLLTS